MTLFYTFSILLLIKLYSFNQNSKQNDLLLHFVTKKMFENMFFMLLFNECSLLLHFEQLAAGPKNTHKFQSRRNYLYFGGPKIEMNPLLYPTPFYFGSKFRQQHGLKGPQGPTVLVITIQKDPFFIKIHQNPFSFGPKYRQAHGLSGPQIPTALVVTNQTPFHTNPLKLFCFGPKFR